VQFPLDQPIPLGLISRITKFCVKRNLEKASHKKAQKAQKKITQEAIHLCTARTAENRLPAISNSVAHAA
jgi:hypothetical protein